MNDSEVPPGFFPSPSREIFTVVIAIPSSRSSPALTSVAAESPFWFRTRFVHHQGTSLEFVLVELADRPLRIIVGRHLDERETARASGRHVAHDADVVDLAGAAEEIRELFFGR